MYKDYIPIMNFATPLCWLTAWLYIPLLSNFEMFTGYAKQKSKQQILIASQAWDKVASTLDRLMDSRMSPALSSTWRKCEWEGEGRKSRGGITRCSCHLFTEMQSTFVNVKVKSQSLEEKAEQAEGEAATHYGNI